jgi:hypothetical protein
MASKKLGGGRLKCHLRGRLASSFLPSQMVDFWPQIHPKFGQIQRSAQRGRHFQGH